MSARLRESDNPADQDRSGWTAFSIHQEKKPACLRSVEKRVRRATLVTKGLGGSLSPAEYREMMTRFSATLEEGRAHRDPNYYAAGSPAGLPKLTEMVEESAFWSAFLLRRSAERTWKIFVGLLVALLVVLFMALPFMVDWRSLSSVRVICCILTLLVSADILGAAMAYSSAAR